MYRNLVIGYGNLDRMDDGIAFYVVNELRCRLGQKPLYEYNTSLEHLGAHHDSVFIRQLVPELTDTASTYNQIVFVDAHARKYRQKIVFSRIHPKNVSATFTHLMHPSGFLLMIKKLNEHEPVGYLLSIQGHRFDFGRGLSAATEKLVNLAVDIIWNLFFRTTGEAKRLF
jgi:hydrogenase maturation protease